MNANTAVVSPIAKDWTVFSDGNFKKVSDVHYLPNNQALNYGTGIFEGIRGYWDADEKQLNLFKVYEHYERFLKSANVLKIDLAYSVEELVKNTIELIKLNHFKQDIYIRPLALKKSLMPGTKFGVKLSGVDSTMCISALPMGSYVNPEGITCLVSKWQRVANDAVPSSAKITGVYVNSALAYEDAQEQGFDDAIMLNNAGHCTEATTSNIFIITDNDDVITPPLSAGLLNGITRQTVIEICQSLGFSYREENLSKSDLYQAKNVFLTGTGIEILPVKKVDHSYFRMEEGNVVHRIITEYNRGKKKGAEKYCRWLTSVY